jgi:hypothetical protein
MVSDRSNRELLVNTDIRGFFYDSVVQAVTNQHLKATDNALSYLVNLLASFTHAEEALERAPGAMSGKPLAFIYADAVDAPSPRARNETLKQLGDIALFISGVFPHSLQRKMVDVDYYIAMGGNAYGYLSTCGNGSFRWRAYQEVFDELSANFPAFVDVLGEVSDHSHFNRNTSALRLYEVWMKTGSKRMLGRLAELGIRPAAGSISQSTH